MKKILASLGVLFSTALCAQPGTSWSLTGPNNFPVDVSGQINGIGRCTQLKFDPVDPYRIYSTSASGGLWVSNDTGSTWTNVGTDFFPYMQCASICIDHSNNSTLYLGSGDPNYYGGGYGVWKSTNGGTNWSLSNTGMGNVLVVEIIMDPTNNQRLIAATDAGIYRSTNAGANWSLVKNGGDFKAMVLKPYSKDTAYAVTSSQIWRSLNFGATWTQITSGVFVPGGNGQGMRLAVSPANPNVVYVGEIADEGTILKSTNAGTSFTTAYHNPAQSLVSYDATSPGQGQGDYNFQMTCDPANANIVYVAAHVVWKSTNGGTTWTKLTDWWDKCHTDMHGINIHPQFTGMLFNTNDGGIFLSRDGGSNWTSRCDGIGATEIYHAAQSKLQRDIISIGTQDNGELYAQTGGWFTNRGGDWTTKCRFPYNSANTVYYYQNGNRRPVSGSETSYNLPFTATDNQCLDFNRKIPNVGFAALTQVYKSLNLNAGSPTWTQVGNINQSIVALHSSFADSSALYAFGDNNTLYRCDNVFAATPTFTSYPAPGNTNVEARITSINNNANVIYVACGDKIYRSANKGASFTNISTGITTGINILGVYHDEYSTNEDVYVCTAKSVYYKNAGMSGWSDISYNLPTIADITEFMFFNSGNASSVLRVGYYGRGVWELPINVSQAPSPAFTANQVVVCPNTNIVFTDLSIGNPTGWQWSFPGGNPASSTQQNPTISYPSPGVYAVTLTVTNGNGSNSLTQSAYITVTAAASLPLTEGFPSFLPTDWAQYDDGQDATVWQHNTNVGGYGNSNECAYFDNYNIDAAGKRDELRTKTFSTSGITHPVLTFDVAYARYDATYSDTLAVLISGDCGQSFADLYEKGGPTLATSPDNTAFFAPSSTQWRTDTVDLLAYANMPELLIAFQNRGRYGNALYLDNINLYNKTGSAVNSFDPEVGIMAYPNPASQRISVIFKSISGGAGVLQMMNADGQRVYTSVIENNELKQVDVSAFSSGLYFITLLCNNRVYTKKLVIE